LSVVGAVSRTMLQHCIQVVPIAVVLVVLARRPRWGAYGALPIFAIWIFIVVLIWLYLLGVARVVTGVFSPTEIVCTTLMAAFSAVGLVSSISLGRPFQPVQLLTLVLFVALQVAALWVSFGVSA
jgi:hypothetical protein